MAANLFEDKDLQYAYNILHDFFDFFGVSHALRNTEQLLTAAVGAKISNKGAPSRLLWLNEN